MNIGSREIFKENTDVCPYARVEYLRSTGTQYINLNYVPTSQTKLEVEFRFWDLTPPDGLAMQNGVRNSATGEVYQLMFRCQGGSITALSKLNSVSIAADTQKHIATIDLKNNKISIDSNIVSIAPSSDQATKPMYLFARNAGAGPQHFSKLDLMMCKLYENDILSADLKPVKLTNGSGQPEGALYDVVSKQIFGNNGTGNFTLGPDVK